MSMVCRQEGLASHLSHKRIKCSAVGGDSDVMRCENLKTSSIGKKRSGDQRSSACLQTDLSEENVCSQPQSDRESDFNGETSVFPTYEESFMEPKEEVEVEDTPIWDSEDENMSTGTDFSSYAAGEESRNRLSPVLGTICKIYSCDTSPIILKNESKCSIPKFPVSSIPSSTNTSSTSPFVCNIPIEQGGGAMEDPSCVREELSESICVKSKPVVKNEVVSAVFPLCSENILKPMHEVWVEDTRCLAGEKEMIETHTAVTHNQETTDQVLDIASTSVNHQLAAWPNFTFTASSYMMAQRDKKGVKVQQMKIKESEMKRCTEQKLKTINTSDRKVDNVVESGKHGVAEIEEGKLEKEECEIVGMVEKALETDTTVEQIEAKLKVSASRIRISKILGKKSYKCPRCPNVYDSVSYLQEHVEKLHGKEHSHHCEDCMATFVSRRNLMRHLRGHADKHCFQCEVCGRIFAVRSSLTVHTRIHTGERPFQCEVCEKSFRIGSHLTEHKRKHTGERPFQCEVCKKSFSERSKLTIHARKHTGERPYQCEMCESSFSERGNLIKHKRIHTGERPFQCEVCKMSFSQVGSLAVHKRMHTGERPFQCEVCQKSFSVKSNLIRHMHRHKSDNPL